MFRQDYNPADYEGSSSDYNNPLIYIGDSPSDAEKERRREMTRLDMKFRDTHVAHQQAIKKTLSTPDPIASALERKERAQEEVIREFNEEVRQASTAATALQFTQHGPPVFSTPHPNVLIQQPIFQHAPNTFEGIAERKNHSTNTPQVIGFDQNTKPILTQYNLYNNNKYQFSHEQLILLANILNQRGCSTDELMNLVNQYQSGNKKPFIDLVIKSGIGKQTIFESEIANFLNYKGIPTNEALSCINDNTKMANLLNAVGINTDDALKIAFGKDEETFARIKNV